MTLCQWFLQLAVMAPMIPLGIFLRRQNVEYFGFMMFMAVTTDFSIGLLAALWIVAHCESLFESVIEWWHTRSYEKIIRQLKLEPRGEP